ncbi:YIP1 family protein [Melghirimyces algeriensis]|uniref:Yip1 domain-containing protein n=1 Tax=Melghirimyces algeriensis TaxID=910412 RepID=A0A521FGA9_9BACL|nr:YIP1 family protein [Melghirimyces algeriensis]SMO95179.1 hypothetical protein SAMN06264849_11924 [Melghirimyces algeriensis]
MEQSIRIFFLSPRVFFTHLRDEQISLWKLILFLYFIGLVISLNIGYTNQIGNQVELGKVLLSLLLTGFINGLLFFVTLVPFMKWFGNLLGGSGDWLSDHSSSHFCYVSMDIYDRNVDN